MNHLERAKSWIQKSTRTAALAVLPLAAASVAQASITFSDSAFFDGSGGYPDPSGQVTPLPLLNNIAGAEYSLTAPNSNNTSDLDFQIYTSAAIDSLIPAGTMIPLSWSIDVVAGGSITGGQIFFSFVDMTPSPFSQVYLGQFQQSFNTAGPFIGTGSFELTSDLQAGHVLNLMIGIYANATSGPVTYNSATATVNPVPEPGTIGLLAVGGFGLIAFRRRKRSA